jgi:hypothetical protein
MGRMFEKTYRRHDAAIAQRVIDEDRFCRMCQYNLRGLSYGGACPECGGSILAGDDSRDALRDVPLRSIVRLGFGLWMQAAAQVGVIALPLLLRPALRASPLHPWLAMLVIAGAWAVGAWLATRPIDSELGILNGYGSRAWLRRIAGLAAIAWPLLTLALLVGWSMRASRAAVAATAAATASGAGAPAVTILPPAPAPVQADWMTLAALLAGMAALMLMAWLHQRLAHWMYDLRSFQMLNWSTWGIGLTAIWTVLTQGTWNWPVTAAVVLAIWVAAIVCQGLALRCLAMEVSWSVQHAREGSERDRRRRHRRTRETRARQAADAAGDEIEPAPGRAGAEADDEVTRPPEDG